MRSKVTLDKVTLGRWASGNTNRKTEECKREKKTSVNCSILGILYTWTHLHFMIIELTPGLIE